MKERYEELIRFISFHTWVFTYSKQYQSEIVERAVYVGNKKYVENR